LLAVLGLLLTLAGCRIPEPTVRQGLDYGFRTPEQAFRSWRTAVQGDLLVEEYKTLSKGWRARNGNVSLFDYSEARDAILERYPQLRWALYRAKDPEVLARGERVALLQSRVPGPLWFQDRWLVVRLVRDGFWDAWLDTDPYQPSTGQPVRELVDSGTLTYSRKERALYARAKLDAEAEELGRWPDDVSLLQVGWEWKIDDFQLLEAPLSPDDPLPGG